MNIKKRGPLLGLGITMSLATPNFAQSPKTNKQVVKTSQNIKEVISIPKTYTHEEILEKNADSLEIDTLRHHMMIETNKIRKKYESIGSVELHPKINQCAQDYAEYMYKNNRFHHIDKEGKRVINRIQKYGFTLNDIVGIRENLGKGHLNIGDILNQRETKDSYHAEALLRDGLTHIGIGYYKGYWVLILIQKEE